MAFRIKPKDLVEEVETYKVEALEERKGETLMTLLDTSFAVDRAKSRRTIDEDIAAETLVEFLKILYYKLSEGRAIISQ